MIDTFIRSLFLLSPIRKKMFVNLLHLMKKIEKNSDKNQMTKENLSTVVGVNILRSKDPDIKTMMEDANKSSLIFSNLIEYLDEYCLSIF